MKYRVFIVGVLGLGAAFLNACEVKEPCDSGFTFDYGLCLPDEADNAGGAGGDAGEDDGPNFGAECTEMGMECLAGTVCALPRAPNCVGLCGVGEPFDGKCPEDKPCTDFGEAFICFGQ